MSGLAPSHQHSGGKSNNEVVSWAGLVSKGSSVETEGAGLKFTYTGKSTAIPEIPPGQESAGGEADFNTTDEKFCKFTVSQCYTLLVYNTTIFSL